MKVLCIKKDNNWVDDTGLSFTGPKFGEEVTATQCKIFPDNYELAEYVSEPDGRMYSFRKQFFIPLSTIDETELLRERESNLINI